VSTPWLHVVGIGEDGLESLTPTARVVIASAEVLAGGRRHLAMIPENGALRIAWSSDFDESVAALEHHRGKRVVVLASGDPMDFGVGASIGRHFRVTDFDVLPTPGSVSLACARLGWARQEVDVISIHGRPIESLHLHLAPGAKLLVLSRDGKSPGEIGRLLKARGYGMSVLTVLERLGGPGERVRGADAELGTQPDVADLNIVAIDCLAGPGAKSWSRAAGLPDEAFHHDGQITKREVRAVTLSALAPLPGELLWDIGAGAGSIAIEWLRVERRARAAALERRADRVATIAANAAALGVPHLTVVDGQAPVDLGLLPPSPDAVFVGGGLETEGLLERCWQALHPGGRLVANAVSLSGEARLLKAHEAWGGNLIRITIEREKAIGRLAAMTPLRPVLQWAGTKP
jgi:precorrin-6B C5,15-methyltransferase / cobalt-precorrin-6B C5,C15-methyltransferase